MCMRPKEQGTQLLMRFLEHPEARGDDITCRELVTKYWCWVECKV